MSVEMESTEVLTGEATWTVYRGADKKMVQMTFPVSDFGCDAVEKTGFAFATFTKEQAVEAAARLLEFAGVSQPAGKGGE